MKERPILFSGPMVRALLAGTKTQTRRVVRDGAWLTRAHEQASSTDEDVACPASDAIDDFVARAPYGVPGDRLWVRETFALPPGSESPGDCVYRADLPDDGKEERSLRRHVRPECRTPWTPSIYMRRPCSRVTLEVTNVRVERLQDITEDDALAEGIAAITIPTFFDKPGTVGRIYEIEGEQFGDARTAYSFLWDGINGARAPWEANPWVWIVEFRRVTA